MVHVADQVLVCSHYMRGDVADVFGIDEERIVVAPNGIDPDDLQPVQDLASLRAQFAAPDEKLVLLVGRLSTRRASNMRWRRWPGPTASSRASAACASWSPAQARTSGSSRTRRAASA